MKEGFLGTCSSTRLSPSRLNLSLQEPLAFLGGFFVGFLGVNLEDEPLNSWLEERKIESRVRIWTLLHYLSDARHMSCMPQEGLISL